MHPNITLALVHLGDTDPSHLWANLTRIRSEFPNLELVLISDSDRIIEKAKQKEIHSFRYIESKDENNFLIACQGAKDFDFRNGFWKYSLQRIFALIQFHNSLGEKPLLHIENDIYLSKNFPFDQFASFKSLAWLRYNSTHDAAAILFTPTIETSQKLKKWIFESESNTHDLTDMTLLNKIARSHTEIQLLPLAGSIHSSYLNKDLMSHHEIEEATRNYSHFNGFFDPAAIGMWLCGIDPRNNFGVKKRFVEIQNSYVAPSRMSLQISSGLMVTDSQESLFNLHIHSKSLKILGNKKEDYLEKLSHSNRATSLVPSAFFAVAIDYHQRKKLNEFFYNIPPFTILRKFKLFVTIKDYVVSKLEKMK